MGVDFHLFSMDIWRNFRSYNFLIYDKQNREDKRNNNQSCT